MNRLDNLLGLRTEARIRYQDADFQVLSPGDYVRCAVSGRAIPISELRYWSVERQEAYAGPAESLKRYLEIRAGPGGETKA